MYDIVVGDDVVVEGVGVKLKQLNMYSNHVHSSSPVVVPFLAPYPHPYNNKFWPVPYNRIVHVRKKKEGKNRKLEMSKRWH